MQDIKKDFLKIRQELIQELKDENLSCVQRFSCKAQVAEMDAILRVLVFREWVLRHVALPRKGPRTKGDR